MTATAFLSPDSLAELDKATLNKGRFINPSKLPDGVETRLRFVLPGITGYGGWTTDKKPIRFEMMPAKLPENLAPNMNGTTGLRFFIAGLVWEYETKSFKIVEFTQSTLIEAIKRYTADADYGNALDYDIKITRTGSDLNTKYSLMPSPPKPLAKEIVDAMQADNFYCNLNALFDNEDPFAKPSA